MNVPPIRRYFVVNREQETCLRYTGTFVPRVGDTIVIGRTPLKVVDVVVESGQDDGAGVQHSLAIHVEGTKTPLAVEVCQFAPRTASARLCIPEGSGAARRPSSSVSCSSPASSALSPPYAVW